MHKAEGLDSESLNYIRATVPGRFFWWLSGHPNKVILLLVTLIILTGTFLPRLSKDTSAEAFISEDHHAVVYRNLVEETFGLSDPVILALQSKGSEGIFNPVSLNLVNMLSKEMAKIEGVDPERVISLTTESNIEGDTYGISVSPFYVDTISTQNEADQVRERVMATPLYSGSLVSADATVTLIIAELLDQEMGNHVYHEAMLLREAVSSRGNTLYVAGEGVVAEHLSEYVDNDARRLYPVLILIIMVILAIAYRTLRGIFLPMLVVLSSLVVALGSMAGFGVPYYIITSALPVILISIGVADGIHIMGQYYDETAIRRNATSREIVVRTMVEMWHPIFFTSLTDAAGFIALALASLMPPMQAFGVFASIGVLASMVLSLLLIPAILVKLSPRTINRLGRVSRENREPGEDLFGHFMGWLGEKVIKHPRNIITISSLIGIMGCLGATQLTIDYQRIDYFHPDEEIYKADKVINSSLNGTNFIDIVVETPETEGLFKPERLAKIEAFQVFVEGLPHVGGTTSVVDYIKQMNRAINENNPEYYSIPEDENLIAQYFLLYSTAGDPTDFEEEIDYEYAMANVRVAMNSGRYSHIRPVIEELQAYIDTKFQDTDMKVTLAGRSNITYHWVKDLAWSHFAGVFAALIAIWCVGTLSFRSKLASLYAITPVVLGILSIYAAMGIFDIWLGIGTSMFAAIAIGISVNFAIHTLDRILELVREYEDSLTHALRVLFPSTGRALLFNFSCVFFGFSVLMTSQVPPLTAFGILVAIAVDISFLASVTLLPAMLLVFQPAFLTKRRADAPNLDNDSLTVNE